MGNAVSTMTQIMMAQHAGDIATGIYVALTYLYSIIDFIKKKEKYLDKKPSLFLNK